MIINDFIYDYIQNIRKHPNKFFLENYVYKHGSKEMIAITISEQSEYLYCLYACHFIISKISYKNMDLFLIQVNDKFTDDDYKNINRILEHFGTKKIKITPNKIDWKYDLICDEICKHQPINTFGMLCSNTFNRIFNETIYF